MRIAWIPAPWDKEVQPPIISLTETLTRKDRIHGRDRMRQTHGSADLSKVRGRTTWMLSIRAERIKGEKVKTAKEGKLRLWIVGTVWD